MDRKQAEAFVRRNARPLDLARRNFLFVGGSRADVLTARAAYQNPDGGFGMLVVAAIYFSGVPTAAKAKRAMRRHAKTARYPPG